MSYILFRKDKRRCGDTGVEGNQALFSTYSLCIIIPSIIGAACFPPLFRLNRKAYNQIVQEIQERKGEKAGN